MPRQGVPYATAPGEAPPVPTMVGVDVAGIIARAIAEGRQLTAAEKAEVGDVAHYPHN